jgi:hypothetical protein
MGSIDADRHSVSSIEGGQQTQTAGDNIYRPSDSCTLCVCVHPTTPPFLDHRLQSGASLDAATNHKSSSSSLVSDTTAGETDYYTRIQKNPALETSLIQTNYARLHDSQQRLDVKSVHSLTVIEEQQEDTTRRYVKMDNDDDDDLR